MNGPAPEPAEGSLLFVYNADSGLFNTLTDIAHKLLAPDSYACSLCRLTHGYLHERTAWRRFLTTLDRPCLFRHRDQLHDWPELAGQDLPAVFRRHRGRWQRCLGPADIAACNDLPSLQGRIREACVRGCDG